MSTSGSLLAPGRPRSGEVVVPGFTQASLDAAVAALPATGGRLLLPAGTYVGHLHVSGVSDLVIEGAGAVLAEPDETVKPVSLSNCDRLRVNGLRATCSASTVRNSTGHGISLTGCTDVVVKDCTVADVSAAGIFVTGCERVRVDGCAVADSLADGFHVTGPSKRVTVTGCHATDTGDDAFAVVGYQAQGAPCESVIFDGCTALRSKSRGFALIGAQRSRICDCDCDTTTNSGIFIAQDATYDTYGSEDCQAIGNTIVDSNTHNTPTTDQPAIRVYSASATYPVKRVVVSGNSVVGGTAGGRSSRGIDIGGTDAGTVANVHVVDNIVEDPTGIGVHAGHVAHVRIIGNTVSRATQQGIAVTSSVTGSAVVAHNLVEDANEGATAGTDAFFVQAANADIFGNRVIDTTGNIERDFECSGSATDAWFWGNRPGSLATEHILTPSASRMTRSRALTEGTAAPASGTWKRGDIVFNTSPSASGTVGWVCTADGAPGTWKTFGAISA